MTRIFAGILAVALAAAPAAAQDVIRIGQERGVDPPEWVLRALERDPHAFEFDRAWTSALREVQLRRAGLTSAGLDVRGLGPQQAATRGAAVSGAFRVPVIVVAYSNTGSIGYDAVGELEDKLFGSFDPISLTDLYAEMSRGVFDLDGDVFGVVDLSNDDRYYEGDDNGVSPQLGELIREAVDAVDPQVDFSDYDRDGDGLVDFIALVHPEDGGECGTANIWSHRSSYGMASATGGTYMTQDGVAIHDYVIQPAWDCEPGEPVKIGVFAHEFGHALGLPDLYSTSYANAGIGNWGLMGGSFREDSPTHLSAWSKLELGWVQQVTIDSDESGYTLDPAQTTGAVVRIDVPEEATTNREYFLLENRQKTGSDAYLPDSGLLIWHVDSAVVRDRSTANTIQNETSRKGIDLEEADGRSDLDRSTNNGDAGDPYPGSSGNSAFDDSSSPNSLANSERGSGIAITNIRQTGEQISFDVSFGTPGELIVVWGDVDTNGTIDMTDVGSIYDWVAGVNTGLSMSIGDVDGDGDTDARDGLIVQSFIDGLDVGAFRVGARREAGASGDALRLRPAPAGLVKSIPVKRRGSR